MSGDADGPARLDRNDEPDQFRLEDAGEIVRGRLGRMVGMGMIMADDAELRSLDLAHERKAQLGIDLETVAAARRARIGERDIAARRHPRHFDIAAIPRAANEETAAFLRIGGFGGRGDLPALRGRKQDHQRRVSLSGGGHEIELAQDGAGIEIEHEQAGAPIGKAKPHDEPAAHTHDVIDMGARGNRDLLRPECGIDRIPRRRRRSGEVAGRALVNRHGDDAGGQEDEHAKHDHEGLERLHGSVHLSPMKDRAADSSLPAAGRGVRHRVTAGPAQRGERLDRVLATALPAISRTRLKSLIEQGHVSRNRATISDPSHRVKPGDVFAVFVPPAAPAEPRPQEIPLAIVYEDDAIIVIDKPAGLVVHPAAGNRENTLVNALLAHCGASLSGIGGVMRPGIVHRLDKDTTGLMVVAKTDAAHASLARQLESRTMTRVYRAVVRGVPRPAVGEVSGKIGRNPRSRKKMAVVTAGGKPAVTRYKVLKTFDGEASLIECSLQSGRTHQIRVHMAAIGHPVLGDPVYGGRLGGPKGSLRERIAVAAKCLGRQALHAYLIRFTHPTTGHGREFVSAFPRDIKELIDSLEKYQK